MDAKIIGMYHHHPPTPPLTAPAATATPLPCPLPHCHCHHSAPFGFVLLFFWDAIDQNLEFTIISQAGWQLTFLPRLCLHQYKPVPLHTVVLNSLRTLETSLGTQDDCRALGKPMVQSRVAREWSVPPDTSCSFAAGRISSSYLPRFETQRLKNLDFDLESLIFSASDSEGNAYLLVAI